MARCEGPTGHICDRCQRMLYGIKTIAHYANATPRAVIQWRHEGAPFIGSGIHRYACYIDDLEAWLTARGKTHRAAAKSPPPVMRVRVRRRGDTWTLPLFGGI